MTTTETQRRTIAEICEDLERAQDAQAVLEDEIRSLPEAMREAARAEEEALVDSALSGKGIKKGSRLPTLMTRRDELPGLKWAADLRVLRLQQELYKAQMHEAAERRDKAMQRAAELEEPKRKLEQEYNEQLGIQAHESNIWRERNRAIGEIGREIGALEYQGPDPSVVQRNSLKRAQW
jgi:hypothetical protein